MNITFNLPQELEQELCAEASGLNLSLSEYILQILSTRRDSNSMPKTGAELVAYWHSIGVVNSRPDITDSQEYARNLRHEAQTRALS